MICFICGADISKAAGYNKALGICDDCFDILFGISDPKTTEEKGAIE